MNYLFDTDIVVDLLRGDLHTIENIKQRNIFIEDISVSVLSVFELMEGAYLSNRESELILTKELIDNFFILDVTKKIASDAGKVSSFLKRKGKTIGIGDILIGVTAVVGNKILVTRNVKHFSVIPNLKIITW